MRKTNSDQPDADAPAAADLVKVRFPLSAEDSAMGVDAENLWAEALGGDRYRIDNIPFYAYGVSARDVITAAENGGRLTFREVIIRGGHSTYRVLVKDPEGHQHEGFQRLWRKLRELGCRHEVAKRRWVAIDVPPPSDVRAVYRILEAGEKEEVWSFEEADFGHTL